MNFSKVRRAEISGIDADDLSAKVGKFGRIGRRWECKRHSLDGHRIVLSAKLILELDFLSYRSPERERRIWVEQRHVYFLTQDATRSSQTRSSASAILYTFITHTSPAPTKETRPSHPPTRSHVHLQRNIQIQASLTRSSSSSSRSRARPTRIIRRAKARDQGGL